MSAELCSVCNGIFENPLTLSEEQPHHLRAEDFLEASSTCYICRTITTSSMWEEFERRIKLSETLPPAVWFLAPHTFEDNDDKRSMVWFKLTIDHDWGGMDAELYPPSNDESEDLPEFYPHTPVWEFRIYSSQDDDVVDKRSLPLGLNDSAMLDLPKKWFSDCVTEHTLCKPPDPSFLPTRLIEIIDDDMVRLISTENHDLEASYVAFSHCWGRAKTLKLVHGNLTRLHSGIGVSELPTSYKEAIAVCREMNFSFIWIDSLCIIQDSFEDWQREALTMKDVYQNSALNLCAASAAENSQASFATRDTSLILPIKIVPRWQEPGTLASSWHVAKFDMYEEEVSSSPLNSRAWVVQETYLSHRTLSLTTSQLWWECRQKVACEAFPCGHPKESIYHANTNPQSGNRISGDSEAERWQIEERWYRLVENYARCGLTVPTDKLIAFAGLAQTFKTKFLHDQYITGLWRSQLPLSLCWSTTSFSLTYRPRKYIAPSWSWASVKGIIQIPLVHDRTCYFEEKMIEPLRVHCNVLDVRVDLADARYDTGQVSSGQMDLQGHLIGPMDWEASTGDMLKVASQSDTSSDMEISLEEGGEVQFDESSKDGSIRMAWFDGSVANENPEEEAESEQPPSFLVPVAEFDASNCDPPHAPAMFGIIVCRVDSQAGSRYYRVGNFEHIVLPEGMLERFPQERVTLD